jgi:hypothetical protein
MEAKAQPSAVYEDQPYLDKVLLSLILPSPVYIRPPDDENYDSCFIISSPKVRVRVRVDSFCEDATG